MSVRTIAVAVLAFALAAGVGFGIRWYGKSALGEECRFDGDCRDADAICLQTYADRTCTRSCTADDQCPEGEVCREADLHGEGGAAATHTVCAPPPPTLDTFREP